MSFKIPNDTELNQFLSSLSSEAADSLMAMYDADVAMSRMNKALLNQPSSISVEATTNSDSTKLENHRASAPDFSAHKISDVMDIVNVQQISPEGRTTFFSYSDNQSILSFSLSKAA